MPTRFERVANATTVVHLVALLFAERRFALRAWRESRTLRFTRNGAIGIAAIGATSLVERPLVTRAIRVAGGRGRGVVRLIAGPSGLRAIVAVAALDYALYGWHVMLHRVPLLWRFHIVHHVDRDCDVTTAARIHGVELAFSAAYRVAVVLALGVTREEYALWESLFGISILFHHANVRLPPALERVLEALVMTPRRHGIHHLAARDAQDGNFSSGLILWDVLHRSVRDGDARGTMGLPAYQSETDVTLRRLVALPFTAQRDAWQAP
ncbi:MAG: sterol desaturase family protein [Vulcanimicrobiaceae bacterium]